MIKQASFASLTFDAKKKQTRREKFLAEMEQAVPWDALLAVIEPYFPKAGRRGRQPMPLEAMLRIYFLQQWYALSDPGLEDALYEIESMRRFAGLELVEDALPDETTILNFRRLLERHELTAQLMNTINDVLEQKGLLLKGGTMVSATLIHAAPSTNLVLFSGFLAQSSSRTSDRTRRTRSVSTVCSRSRRAAISWPSRFRKAVSAGSLLVVLSSFRDLLMCDRPPAVRSTRSWCCARPLRTCAIRCVPTVR